MLEKRVLKKISGPKTEETFRKTEKTAKHKFHII
jgi:hypothetical protein